LLDRYHFSKKSCDEVKKNGVVSFIWTTTKTVVPQRNGCSISSIRKGPLFSEPKGNFIMRTPKN
jgi:hypothetical protein